jgi:hypothetical protein
LIASLLPLQSFARDYSVEAIIFTNTVPSDAPADTWDEKAPRNIRAQNKLDNLYQQAVKATQAREVTILNKGATVASSPEPADPADTGTAQPPIDTVISSDLLALQAIHNKLAQNSRYEIIQTLSWNQSEADYQASPLINTLTPHMKGVIRVYAPNLLFAELNLTYVPDEILPESLLEKMGANVGEPHEIEQIIVEPSYSASEYGSDYSQQAVVEPDIVHYFIEERRNLKLNEIHYFDHPRFGVILSVKPLENPAPQS